MAVYGIPENLWKTRLKRGVAHAAALVAPLLPIGPAGALGILTYHRLAPACPRFSFPTWNVTPERFERQLRGLLRLGYRPLALRDALARQARQEPFLAREFVVTFDDGYANVFQFALPILRRLRVPATIFLPTAFLDSTSPFPFEDWPPAAAAQAPRESWLPLTTQQCREMLDTGLIELGSHTHRHRRLPGQPDEFARELRASIETLERLFGLERPTFSFPFGAVDEDLRAVARQAGLACGLTTQADLVLPGDDPFLWGRFSVDQHDTPATIAVKLSGNYTRARNVFRTVKRLCGLPVPARGMGQPLAAPPSSAMAVRGVQR